MRDWKGLVKKQEKLFWYNNLLTSMIELEQAEESYDFLIKCCFKDDELI